MMRSFFMGLIVLLGCSESGNLIDPPARQGYALDWKQGTVTYFNFEGGFYAIEGKDGETYDPINLPKKYQVDGTRIRFKGTIRTDLASLHMVGSIIELTGIEILP